MFSYFYKSIILFCLISSVQLIFIYFFWKEKFECKTVIQILPQSRLDSSDDCWNIESIRQILENPQIEYEIIQKYNLTEYKYRKSYKQLIEKKYQEIDLNNNIVKFRFRYHNPAITQAVVEHFLKAITDFWYTNSKERYKTLLTYELQNIENQLLALSEQTKSIPKTTFAYGISLYPENVSLSSSPIDSNILINFPFIVKSNEILNNLELQYSLLNKRKSEIIKILNDSNLLNTIPRLRIIVPPKTTYLPIWPSRYDLLAIALINSLLISLTYYIVVLSLSNNISQKQ